MRRRSMLTGVWALSTLAATLVAWGAVRLVADQVSPGTVASLPTAVALGDIDLAIGPSDDPSAAPRSLATQRPRTNPTVPAGRPAGDTQDPAAPGGAGEPDPAGRPADDPGTQPKPQQPAAGEDHEKQPAPNPQPAATTTAYELVGGVVTVRYQGTSTRLIEASPNSGFVVEVRDGGPGKVDVRFRSDDHESRFVTRIHNGSPDPERDERPR